MSQTQSEKNGVLKSFREDHRNALTQVAKLDEALLGLQFEGKTSAGLHLNQIRSVIGFFLTSFAEHTELEDQIVFPYLASHIPKIELVLPFLHSEHEALEENLKHLEVLINLFSDKPSEAHQLRIITQLREVGAYLIYLLRHHIEAERTSIYQMIDSELRPNERKELKERLNGKAISHVER